MQQYAYTSASVSPLLALGPGPTRVLRSSSGLKWEGILVERHASSPGDRAPAFIDRHVVSMLCSNSSQFDYQLEEGRLARFSEHRGSVTFTPAGPVPYIRLQSSAEFAHCAFQQSLVRSILEEMDCPPAAKPVFRAGVRDRSIQRILVLLLQELDERGPSGRLYVDSLAHALVHRYLFLSRACPPVERRTSALPPRLLNRVKEKIEANLDADLSLNGLARESGYSRAHFLRMFQVATGVTPHQYILDLRIKKAQDHIRKSADSLIDIAAFCGFSSQSHMTSLFRKHLDVTPAEFRRNL